MCARYASPARSSDRIDKKERIVRELVEDWIGSDVLVVSGSVWDLTESTEPADKTMTLVDQVSSKMASVASGTRNTLSFSISRLLEKSGDDPADALPKGCGESLVDLSPAESRHQMDDSDEEDIKVNDSDDDESTKITTDYPLHPAPSIGLDWYTLYALQHQHQQQQQHPHGPGNSGNPHGAPAMFPSHLMNSAYVNVPHSTGSSASGSAAETYLSYLNRSLPGSTAAGSVSTSSTAAGFPAPMAQMQLGSLASAQESLSPANMQQRMVAVDGINSGIPNAFAALLEATVFKDRLAAGWIKFPTSLVDDRCK